MNSLFASTARGLEELLKTELENPGPLNAVVQGGVHFKGDTRLVYQSLMWSRGLAYYVAAGRVQGLQRFRPLSRCSGDQLDRDV